MCLFANAVKIFAGTDYGVYISFDTGKTYSYMGIGLPSLAIYEMKFNFADSILTAATHGRGMWQIKISTKGIETVNKKYLNTVEGKNVVIFDITGRRKVVINNFNSNKIKNLSSGIYSIKPVNPKYDTKIKIYIVK